MWGAAVTMRRVASSPFSRGICKSIRMTSGCNSAACATAAAPSAASPTTFSEASVASMARSPCRKASWSSQMRMRIGSIPCLMFQSESAR